MGLPQARRGRDAGGAPVLRPRLVVLGQDHVRPAGAESHRLLDDGPLRPPGLRGLDHGPRGVRPLAAHGKQLRYPVGGRGPGRGDVRDREGVGVGPTRVLRSVFGRPARGALRQPASAASGEARPRRLRVHGQGRAHPRRAQEEPPALPGVEPPPGEPRVLPQRLHARPLGRRGGDARRRGGRRGAQVRRLGAHRNLRGHDHEAAARRPGEGAVPRADRASRARRHRHRRGHHRVLFEAAQSRQADGEDRRPRAHRDAGREPRALLPRTARFPGDAGAGRPRGGAKGSGRGHS